MKTDQQLQDELNGQMPIVPHSDFPGAADCCGCIVVQVSGRQASYVCNECRAPISAEDLHRVVSEMPEAMAKCPHCGYMNVFPGFTEMLAFTCQSCGQGSKVGE